MRSVLSPAYRGAPLFTREQKKTYTRIAILAAIFALLLPPLFLTERTQLQCSGKMSTRLGFRPATLYANLERPGWALRHWREPKGALHLEIPQEAVLHYDVLTEGGDLLELAPADSRGDGGTYSMSGGQLALRTPQGLFIGGCSVLN